MSLLERLAGVLIALAAVGAFVQAVVQALLPLLPWLGGLLAIVVPLGWVWRRRMGGW